MRYERQQTPAFFEALFRLGIHPLFRRFWKVELKGDRYLPIQRPCFVYGNHSNNFDPFILKHVHAVGRCNGRRTDSRVLPQSYHAAFYDQHSAAAYEKTPARSKTHQENSIKK